MKKIITTLKAGGNNVLIVSQRRKGESKTDHNKRVEEMQNMFVGKTTKSDIKKLDALLHDAIAAIYKWKEECLSQGKNPSCIGMFMCINRKPEYPFQDKCMIFGEQREVMALLECANDKLGKGEDSLL